MLSVVGEWGDWTTCTADCDGGKQYKDKFCDGQLCDRIESSCHLMPCDGNSKESAYSKISFSFQVNVKVYFRCHLNPIKLKCPNFRTVDPTFNSVDSC